MRLPDQEKPTSPDASLVTGQNLYDQAGFKPLVQSVTLAFRGQLAPVLQRNPAKENNYTNNCSSIYRFFPPTIAEISMYQYFF